MSLTTQPDPTRSLLAPEIALLLGHWVTLLALAVVLLAIAGRVGRGVGLPYIFREDEQVFAPGRNADPNATPRQQAVHLALASPALWSGFGFVATFGLFWIAAHIPRPVGCAGCATLLFDRQAAPRGGIWLLVALSVAAGLVLVASWTELRRQLADFTTRDGRAIRAEMLRTAIGCVMGAALALLAWLIAPLASGAIRNWIVAAPYLGLLVWLFWRRSVLPCLSLFSLIIGVILVGLLLPDALRPWSEALLALLVVVIIVINRGRTRYRLPGFEALYDQPLNPQNKDETAQPQPSDSAPALIPPVVALNGWLARRHSSGRQDKPVLVLVATSGGAYRAAFWTALLLDRLIADSRPGGRWPGLADDIRLLTGASGGMVGAAYFAAMAAEGTLPDGIADRISRDTKRRMGSADGDARLHPIARDSLSPIVHRMVTRDLGHLIWPGRPRDDRGRVLDRQWTTLERSFASVRHSEMQGIAPSVILSPMLVETGAVALFSNLDLMALRRRALPPDAADGDENKASVEVFRTFGGSQDRVSIATAVRLNATFPYVSPAISLPTSPDRRPVDAGYYDNYGIDLLTGWLDQPEIRNWIAANCARVAVIRIRAFPAEPLTRPPSGAARAMQFLTSPIEGLMSARRSGQMFRNDQQLAQTRRQYEAAMGREAFDVFTFEANTDVSLSWYLRCDEFRALDRLLCPPVAEDLVWDADQIRNRAAAPPPHAGLPTSPGLTRKQIEDWSTPHFQNDHEMLIAALQRRDPQALWAQFLHHRAKIAGELTRLETFCGRSNQP
ncbi:MAG: hypothetical protein ACK41U_05055 [Paracoccus sp. (in: a-proteobacteria)]|uniref:hypothetical protein n=1 Tax=Paracoccus sp. TaxID=267 RepID=UPI0039194F75